MFTVVNQVLLGWPFESSGNNSEPDRIIRKTPRPTASVELARRVFLKQCFITVAVLEVNKVNRVP